jgi:tetratricopeptide (TPR) repeat protein
MLIQSTQKLPRVMPDCLKKRRLLNDKNLNPELCRDYGEKFFALGFFEDALEFFRRGNYQDGLDRLKAQAVEMGDAYLMSRLGPQPPEVWRQVAAQALKSRKLHFARRALEQAGDREEAEELAKALQGGGS